MRPIGIPAIPVILSNAGIPVVSPLTISTSSPLTISTFSLLMPSFFFHNPPNTKHVRLHQATGVLCARNNLHKVLNVVFQMLNTDRNLLRGISHNQDSSSYCIYLVRDLRDSRKSAGVPSSTNFGRLSCATCGNSSPM